MSLDQQPDKDTKNMEVIRCLGAILRTLSNCRKLDFLLHKLDIFSVLTFVRMSNFHATVLWSITVFQLQQLSILRTNHLCTVQEKNWICQQAWNLTYNFTVKIKNLILKQMQSGLLLNFNLLILFYTQFFFWSSGFV